MDIVSVRLIASRLWHLENFSRLTDFEIIYTFENIPSWIDRIIHGVRGGKCWLAYVTMVVYYIMTFRKIFVCTFSGLDEEHYDSV